MRSVFHGLAASRHVRFHKISKSDPSIDMADAKVKTETDTKRKAEDEATLVKVAGCPSMSVLG